MKKLSLASVAAAAFAAFAQMPFTAFAQRDLGAENTLRIVSYNIFNGKQADGTTFNYDRQAQIIGSMNADLVAVDEVDSITQRSKGHFALREYAEKLGMHYVYSPAIDYDGGKYGMGMLARKHPLRVTRIALPGREEKRTLIIAEYPDYVFAATHFSLTEADQLKSLDIVRSEAAKTEKPFFFAGDLNFTPESEPGRKLAKYFTLLTNPKDATFPAGNPTQTIDYVAVFKNDAAKRVVLLRNGVPGEAQASDHRPVFADVRLALPADKLLCSEPYLQNFSPSGISVMFQTNAVVHTWVEYGTDTANTVSARTLLAGQEPCFDIENKVDLTDLKPGVRYYYRVCAQEVLLNEAYRKILGDSVRTQWYSFRLPDAKTEDFTMAVFNDLHDNDFLMYNLASILRHNDADPDFVVFNGDCVPEPNDRAHAISRINTLMRAANAANVPTFIIRGNHEIRNAYSAGMLSLTQNFGGKTYGAFSWGDTRFVVLDCGEDKPDDFWVYYGLNGFEQLRLDQKAFLEKELASKEFKKARRHVLINHIPIWGEGVFTDDYHPWTALWSPLLQKGKFDVDITAHAHSFYVMEPGDKGNPMPCIGGGGPAMEGGEIGTVMALQKKGDKLRLRVWDVSGKLRLDRQL